ncbi:MAG: phosphatase PAP2 family protein [Burkholderiales bacterium]|nr:phosphatase PAP2 family protein [Burkholderiales bacterium]
MPPFLSLMGICYILVAAPILFGLLRDGYWSKVPTKICQMICDHKFKLLLGVILVLVFIWFIDLPVSTAIKAYSEKHPIFHSYWDMICALGDGGVVVGFVFTIFMLARQFSNYKLAEVAKISLMSSLFGGLSNAIFKFIFNRQRPAIGLDPWHFFAFFRSSTHDVNDLMYAFNSMPSGHTISVMAAVVPFILAYKNKKFTPLLILLPFLIAISRVCTLNHWLSDVMLASIFGIVIGVSVYRSNEWRLNEK